MLAKTEKKLIEQVYDQLMEYASGDDNDEIYASMLASWQVGDGIMPDDFGLGDAGFNELIDYHYPKIRAHSLVKPGRSSDASRNDEREEVYKLLIANRVDDRASVEWMAKIVAMACQGQDHLWQDMGLWSRSQLSSLLMKNFPSFAEKNTKNMKWKKFLYKQLCITEGIYTCRAPSCEVCAEYDSCFGSEE